MSEDGNDIPNSGENSLYNPNEENKTSGPPRGDISGSDENPGDISHTKPEEDLVNAVGSKAILTCNAGKFSTQPSI